MLKQKNYDGLQAVVDDVDNCIVQLIEGIGNTNQLFLAGTFGLNHEDVKRLVSHLDYWLLTGKLFREEQKAATEPDITKAGV